MRVLVTGGCGLIGYHTAVYYKNQGHEVVVIDNLERSSLLGHDVNDTRKYFNANLLKDKGIEIFFSDVSNSKTWESVGAFDLILHFAGQCGVPTSIADPRRDMEINLIGTFNVLEHARQNGGTVLFASTNKVYPIKDDAFQFNPSTIRWEFKNSHWRDFGFPVEALEEDSRTPYGWSKYSADLLCQEYYHTYGVRTGVFRMSCIYGKNQFGFAEQGWATFFIIAINKELPITIYGDGFQVRDMLYVEDCVAAYDSFFKSNLPHGVFNLGGGPRNSLSLNECVHFLEELTSRKFNITYADWRPCDQKAYLSDIRPLKEATGWEPKVFPEQGLIKVHSWVRDNADVF